MEGRLLLKDCSVLGSGAQITRARSVVIVGARVTQVEPDAAIIAVPGDWVVPCGGRLVVPGLVECQLLSRLGSRGVPTAAESAAISAHALALGLRHGVTTQIALLDGPDDVRGALESQAACARRLGARLIQAHAAVDARQLDVAAELISAGQRGIVRTALGLSSAFGDLAQAGQQHARLDCAVHLQLAGALEPFDRVGLLTARTVVAGEGSLSQADAQLAAQRGALIATSGRGRAWDAIAPDAPLQARFEAPARLNEAVFGARFGAVAVGQTADLVVLDAVEPGTVGQVDRLSRAPVAWTIVEGRVVVREGQLLGSDFIALAAEAAKALDSVWARR
jgi:5-methylthioadenosine/S-adenosylhomocysteine deaminase